MIRMGARAIAPLFAAQLRGKDDALVAPLLRTAAAGLVRVGRLREALPLAERALAIFARSFGAESGEAADAAAVLGRVCFDCGQFDRAARVLAECLPRLQAVHGETHSTVAKAVESLALVYGEQDNWTKGKPECTSCGCRWFADCWLRAEKEMLTRSLEINKAIFGVFVLLWSRHHCRVIACRAQAPAGRPVADQPRYLLLA